jgi:putative transposase
MFGAMTRAADRWRAIKFTDFERRQIAAVRQDLDQEYQVQITAPNRSSAAQNPARFSSSPRT